MHRLAMPMSKLDSPSCGWPPTPGNAATVAILRAGLRGRVVTGEDADYDALCGVMRGDIDDRPLAITPRTAR